MPFVNKRPIEKEFILERTDAKFGVPSDAPTKVTIRQATTGDNEKRDAFLSSFERSYEKADGEKNGMMRVKQFVNYAQLRRLEVKLCLAACNILNEDGSPLFQFVNGRVVETTFDAAWDSLPPETAEEIYELVLQMNPTWSPF